MDFNLGVEKCLFFNPSVVRLFLSFIAVPLGMFCSCQSVSKRTVSPVPAAIPTRDLDLIDAALKKSPARLAVFQPDGVAAPLDADRSGVIVDLDRQRAYLYSNSQLVAATRIASGKRYYRSPTGDFRIGQKNRDHSSNLYGKLIHEESGEAQPGEIDTRDIEIPEGMVFQGAPMRHFMRFHTLEGKATAIGFHQGYVPGRPASHGCIRMPAHSASELFKIIPKGTPVFVYGIDYGKPARPLPEIQLATKSKPVKKKSDNPSRFPKKD